MSENPDRGLAPVTGPDTGLPDKHGWRTIESAPRDGKIIMLFPKFAQQARVGFWDTARGDIWSLWPGRDPADPTHWQPLPAPPESEQ